MCRTIITNGTIVNDGEHFIGSIIVKGEFIESVIKGKLPENIVCDTDRIIDASGKWILPGVIDDQVHFREPGLTHKAEITTESVAAVAGGITSFMEMPNTVPQTTTLEALEWKYSRAAEVSPANYSFYIGATNDNFEVLKQVDFSQVCGVKIFMGSSTGNMLVDSEKTLRRIFAEIPALIAVHCEQESIILYRTLRRGFTHFLPPSYPQCRGLLYIFGQSRGISDKIRYPIARPTPLHGTGNVSFRQS